MALDVTAGLAFLHSRKIAHLDLKSPNVLMTSDGRAKLTDLGMARLYTASHISAVSSVGTWHW